MHDFFHFLFIFAFLLVYLAFSLPSFFPPFSFSCCFSSVFLLPSLVLFLFLLCSFLSFFLSLSLCLFVCLFHSCHLIAYAKMNKQLLNRELWSPTDDTVRLLLFLDCLFVALWFGLFCFTRQVGLGPCTKDWPTQRAISRQTNKRQAVSLECYPNTSDRMITLWRI